MYVELINTKSNRLKGKNKIVKLTYKRYMSACERIAEDIRQNFDLDEIELVGIARGGLPMLVTLSHLLGIRKVSMIQTQMSNSDSCHDYGEFRYINDCIPNNGKKIILLEDIIYKGKTTFGVIDILKARGQEVSSVYSILADQGFKKLEKSKADIPIKICYEIKENDWCYFFWEQDLSKIKL